MSRLNYDPRPPERQPENEAQADKIADMLIGFGQLAVALGVTIFAIILLISML